VVTTVGSRVGADFYRRRAGTRVLSRNLWRARQRRAGAGYARLARGCAERRSWWGRPATTFKARVWTLAIQAQGRALVAPFVGADFGDLTLGFGSGRAKW